MEALLRNFRDVFCESVIDLLWRQWTTIGVAGHGEQWHGSLIDPEALLLLTCTAGRYDARLFDGMMEWMGCNGQYINVQRLKRIMATEEFAGGQVLRAVADSTSDSVSAAKWATMAAPNQIGTQESLFFLKNGKPMPTVNEHDPLFSAHGLKRDLYKARGVSQAFRPEPVSNLLLRLRALLGVNARAEIIAYLLLNEQGSPGSLARDAYYFPLTISKAMAEIRDSGFLVSRLNGRRRDHRLVPAAWRDLFLGQEHVHWIVWPRILRAIEVLWIFLRDDSIVDKEPLAQASALRRVLLKSVVDRAETSGVEFSFGDLSAYPGEALLTFTIEKISGLLSDLNSH
jgi:hypothetical protein